MNSDRIKNISESQTVKISAKAITMRKAGIDIINLSVGEPDFPTPQNVKDAAKKAIDNNQTKYTVNKGIVELRQAIAHKLKEERLPLADVLISPDLRGMPLMSSKDNEKMFKAGIKAAQEAMPEIRKILIQKGIIK